MGYDFSTEYKKRKENKAADALSRMQEEEVSLGRDFISDTTMYWGVKAKLFYVSKNPLNLVKVTAKGRQG